MCTSLSRRRFKDKQSSPRPVRGRGLLVCSQGADALPGYTAGVTAITWTLTLLAAGGVSKLSVARLLLVRETL